MGRDGQWSAGGDGRRWAAMAGSYLCAERPIVFGARPPPAQHGGAADDCLLQATALPCHVGHDGLVGGEPQHRVCSTDRGETHRQSDTMIQTLTVQETHIATTDPLSPTGRWA